MASVAETNGQMSVLVPNTGMDYGFARSFATAVDDSLAKTAAKG